MLKATIFRVPLTMLCVVVLGILLPMSRLSVSAQVVWDGSVAAGFDGSIDTSGERWILNLTLS